MKNKMINNAVNEEYDIQNLDETNEIRNYINTVKKNINQDTLAKIKTLPKTMYFEIEASEESVEDTDTQGNIKRPRSVRKTDQIIKLHKKLDYNTVYYNLGIDLTDRLNEKDSNNLFDVLKAKRYTKYSPIAFNSVFGDLAQIKADYRIVLLSSYDKVITDIYPQISENTINPQDVLNMPLLCLLVTNPTGDKFYFAFPTDFSNYNLPTISNHYSYQYLIKTNNSHVSLNDNDKGYLTIPYIETNPNTILRYLEQSPIPLFNDFKAFSPLTNMYGNNNIYNFCSDFNKYLQQMRYENSDTIDTYVDPDNYKKGHIQQLTRRICSHVADEDIANNYVIKSDGRTYLNINKTYLKNPFWQRVETYPVPYENNNICRLNYMFPKINLAVKKNVKPKTYYFENETLTKGNRTYLTSANNQKLDFSEATYQEDDSRKLTLKRNQNNFIPLDSAHDMSQLFTILAVDKQHKYFIENGHIVSCYNGYSGSKLSAIKDWNFKLSKEKNNF